MTRRCARPGCQSVAVATLSYDYAGRVVWIEPLHAEGHPATHDLCPRHADRLGVPVGWTRRDLRLERAPYAAAG